MKFVKILLQGIVLCLLTAHSGKSAISISYVFGILYQNSGTSVPFPDGSLIQVIASTTNSTFSTPTSTSFVSGDDIVLFSFNLNSATTGVAGSTSGFSQSIDFVNGISAGDPLLLRWFPTLTANSLTPLAGSPYGEYRNDLSVDGSISWFVPSDGATYDLNFLTGAGGGSNPNSLGSSNLTVVPEPSETAILVAGFGLFAIFLRRRHLSRSTTQAGSV